jgi:hypothetical protein
MDVKIIEKPLFFLGFFNISRKSLEVIGNALGQPLGTPWGALGDALGTPWEALGTPWEALGTPWEALGTPWKALGDFLGKTLEEPLGRSTPDAKALRSIFF